jgi:hypothetical protein
MSQLDRSPAASDARFLENEGDISVIPTGPYCYRHAPERDDTATGRIGTTPCPYWALDPDQPAQMNGSCAFMRASDWEDGGTLLLWDQTKECDINYPE